MVLPFWKVAAAGNDFVLIDGALLEKTLAPDHLARALCDRHLGIGADGLVLVRRIQRYDFAMAYYNADGSGPVMCGNGARAAVLFASQALRIQQERWRFLASDGVHYARLAAAEIQVSISVPRKIEAVQVEDTTGYLVDTGVHHLVLEADWVTFASRAPLLRRRFDANVNYIRKIEESEWQIRTWERGVEGETLACGTGATAAAYVLYRKKGVKLPLRLHAPGGVLTVSWESRRLWLAGPTRKIFHGEIELDKL